jgi:catechol 2,3-dioxygenase-like lactoylglutathione lyase family enzyme
VKLASIDHVYYWTADMDRAIGFYRETLGLRVLSRHEDKWAELDAGPIRLALHGTRDGAPASTGGAAAAFRVDDLDATAAALRDRGVEFVHQGEVEDYGRFALFTDPDGNVLSLIEYSGTTGGGEG